MIEPLNTPYPGFKQFCPVCGRKRWKKYVCGSCGYELSRDYSTFLTLADIPVRTESLEFLQARHTREQEERELELVKEQLAMQYAGKFLEYEEQCTHLQKRIDALDSENKEMRQKVALIAEQLGLEKGKGTQSGTKTKIPGAVGQRYYGNMEFQRQLASGEKEITFGHFPQSLTGQEAPIRWQVLEISDKGIFVLSKNILECRKFNDTLRSDIVWDNSNLRRWLGTDFKDMAFSEEEQRCILQVDHDDGERAGSGGEKSADQVFLLSKEEIDKYLPNNKSRESVATPYAKTRGVYVYSGEDYGYWWLRSRGNSAERIMPVIDQGYVDYDGYRVSTRCIGVRPAMWLSIEG